MPKRKKRHYTPRERTTLRLTGTVQSTQAALSHSTAFALPWAQAWLSRAGSKKVPTGGLIRRALEVYVRHLETCRDPRGEVLAVQRVCTALKPDEGAREAALQRLAAVPTGAPLPPHSDLLLGPEKPDWAALDARVEAHIQAIAATRWGRIRGIK